MNWFRYTFLFAMCAPAFLFSQGTIQQEEDEHILYRDSERWIRGRFRYFFEERAFPLGYIPEEARVEAWRRSQNMSVYMPSISLSKKSGISSQTWTVVGPNNVGGRVTGVSVHPNDPDIVYFTAADGGVWKSSNGGSKFSPISEDVPTMAMGCIEIDPSNPDILYVGTGEANGSGDSYPGVGVLKSTNGGANWELAGAKFADHIAKIRVHRSNSNIIFAATRQGFWRSTNGGDSWIKIHNGLAFDIVLHPTDHAYIYAAIQGTGIIKSPDSGVTWTTLPIPVPTDSIGRIAIDLCISQPNILYAVIVSAIGNSGLKSVLKSTDDGATWIRLENTSTPNFFGSQGWYNIDIAVDPTNPDRVLIGGVQHYISSNGSVSWSMLKGVHVDQHAIEFAPSNPRILYLGNDGGMYKSTNGGETYVNLNTDLPITQFYELGIALQFPDMMMGGTQDRGSKLRITPTVNWSNATGGDGAYCIIDYSNSNFIYAEYQEGVHLRSTNAGSSFSLINNGLIGDGLWVTPVAIHPTVPTILFTATKKLLYKTTNRGSLWFPFHGDLDSTSSINYIAISPRNPNVMLVGYINGNIWKTTDAGSQWTRISTGLPTRICKDIQFDPFEPETYYACYSGYSLTGVYKTTDAGATWINITGSGDGALPAVPKNALAINPGDPKQIFVGTDFGVYVTTNGGQAWQICGTGMPKVVIADLELHPLSGILYAATHGRSVFALAVTTPVEFTSFAAQLDGNIVHLFWRTVGELKSAGFAIERMASIQGQWEEIAFIPSLGSTASVNMYEFTDSQIPLGVETLIYRLKQIDFSGTPTYSHEMLVPVLSSSHVDFVLEQNFPNPFNPVTNIRYSIPATDHVRMTVTNSKGIMLLEVLNKVQQAGTHIVYLDASDLPSGAYFYHLEYRGMRQSNRMLVLK